MKKARELIAKELAELEDDDETTVGFPYSHFLFNGVPFYFDLALLTMYGYSSLQAWLLTCTVS